MSCRLAQHGARHAAVQPRQAVVVAFIVVSLLTALQGPVCGPRAATTLALRTSSRDGQMVPVNLSRVLISAGQRRRT